MKTNIKMRVIPEQNEKVQKIVNGTILDIALHHPFLYITEEDGLQYGTNEKEFEKHETEEIDADLFIRINRFCEKTNKTTQKPLPFGAYGDPNIKIVEEEFTEQTTNLVKNKNAKHYELWDNFEAIDTIKAILSYNEYIGFLKGNILKYQLRLGKKDNTEKEVIKIKDYQRELNNILKTL